MSKKISTEDMTFKERMNYGLELSNTAQVVSMLASGVFISTLMVWMGSHLPRHNPTLTQTAQSHADGLHGFCLAIILALPFVLFAVSRWSKVLNFRKMYRDEYRAGQNKLGNLAPSERWIWKTDEHGDPIRPKEKAPSSDL
jgi:hypothetical protein